MRTREFVEENLSPIKAEEMRLRREANGRFAPAKPGVFAERRKILVELFVQEGLKRFAEEEQKGNINGLTI